MQWSMVNACTPQGEPILGTGGEKKYVHWFRMQFQISRTSGKKCRSLQKVHSSDDSLSLLLTMVPNLSIDKKLGFDIPKCAVSSPRIGIGQMDSKQEFFAPSDVRVMEHHHVQRDEGSRQKMGKPKLFFFICQNFIARRCPQWQEKVRIIAAYAPHVNYSDQDSVNCFFSPHLLPAEGLEWMIGFRGNLQAMPFLYRRLRMCMKGLGQIEASAP